MTTYRVADSDSCRRCSCKKRQCRHEGIVFSEIYQKLDTKKLYAIVQDGQECFGLAEVEPEKREAGRGVRMGKLKKGDVVVITCDVLLGDVFGSIGIVEATTDAGSYAIERSNVCSCDKCREATLIDEYAADSLERLGPL